MPRETSVLTSPYHTGCPVAPAGTETTGGEDLLMPAIAQPFSHGLRSIVYL
jgi:hypothetical protein